MELLALLQLLKDQVVAIQGKLEEAGAAIEVEKSASYNLGLLDGQALKQGEVDAVKVQLDAKQAELDLALAQIEELKKNPVLESEFKFTQADMDQAIALAKSELKAEIKAAYVAQQAQESDSEAKLAELLA